MPTASPASYLHMTSRTTETTDPAADAPDETVVLGVSSCLLGERVRYDGGHKRNELLTGALARLVRFVPICPEMDVGMGTPREPIQLEGSASAPRVIAPGSGTDHTATFEEYGQRTVTALRQLNLSGYVFKRRSPSCGLFDVPVHDEMGIASTTGRGVHAKTVTEAFPLLPAEDEERLEQAEHRENFLLRVFAYQRMRNLFSEPWHIGDLVGFHSGEKMLLLAHDPKTYTRLGRLVAGATQDDQVSLENDYQRSFMDGLAEHATTPKHVNVLQHLSGYFKKKLAASEKDDLHATIKRFQAGQSSLAEPLQLFRKLVREHQVEYLAQQTYLEPHPQELLAGS